MRKLAVHFGAGNIGRGFLGQLYHESGYRTVFVDVVDTVVDAVRRRKSYPLRIVSDEGKEDRFVENVWAVHGADIPAVAEAIAEADIASTAVGVNALPHIAPALAAGIAERFRRPDAKPLNVIVCENLIDAGPFLREEVRNHLDQEWHHVLEERAGFVEASIGRMVPVMTAEQKAEDPLLVCVEPYCELPVDKNAFVGGVPDIAHMKPMANFGAYVERKLFVHNLSHAATAYLGWLRGHEDIWQAIRDAAVRREVEAAARESCTALARRHGLNKQELDAHREDLIHRYHNRGLGDQVARVARDPVRKLGPNDRLLGAARMCLEEGVPPAHIAFAVAAAIQYDPGGDPAARRLQGIRQEKGLEGVLRDICHIEPRSPIAELVYQQAKRLNDPGWIS